MEIQISKKPTYKSLCRNIELVDARLYPPTKRTVSIAGRRYFLQFPQVFAAKVVLEQTPEYWSPSCAVHKDPCCFLNFAFVKEGNVYASPLPQVDYVVDRLGVCLTNGDYTNHVWFKPTDDLDYLMYWFWNTSFSVLEGKDNCFGSYHNWQRMNLDEVLKSMKEPVGTIKTHIKKLRNYAETTNDKMRAFGNRMNG